MKKLNKKGFTLIELLAVIAILAILIVIAVPGVLSMYNKGKESAFKAQAQNIWKAAESNAIVDELDGKSVNRYCDDKNQPDEDKKLELQVKNIVYDIELTDGKVTKITVEQLSGATVVMRATSQTSIDDVTVATATLGTTQIDCSEE